MQEGLQVTRLSNFFWGSNSPMLVCEIPFKLASWQLEVSQVKLKYTSADFQRGGSRTLQSRPVWHICVLKFHIQLPSPSGIRHSICINSTYMSEDAWTSLQVAKRDLENVEKATEWKDWIGNRFECNKHLDGKLQPLKKDDLDNLDNLDNVENLWKRW